MALGSWQGLYNAVITGLMDERREQELLLLMAIAKHCDPFGFCFPGRATLMRLRRCSQPVYERRLEFLTGRNLVQVIEDYDIFRRQKVFIFQVSPRVLYVREDLQPYCEAVFDGERQRDVRWELKVLEQHFSTNDSQPESLPESETRAFKPESGTRKRTREHNQLTNSPTQKGRNASTMRNGQRDSEQPTAANATAHSKDNPQAGAADFSELLSPTVDDDRLADEIRYAVATTAHQAREAVALYPRDGIVHWLQHTATRRARGELKNPGGYFFKMLGQHVKPLIIPGPNGQIEEYELP